MPKRLTREQVERYHADGFCFPVDVMTRAEAQRYRGRLEEAEAGYPEALGATSRNNAHIAFTFMDEIIHHPALLDAVEDLIGPDILCWGSVLFIKEPDTPGYVSWHQDLNYTPIEPHDGVTAWLALSPSNRESGCMRMLPGTHREGVREQTDTFHADNILTRGQTIQGLDPSRAVDLLLEPGQISLHHGRTIHSSQPNRSHDRRIGVVIQQFVPPHVRERDGRGYAVLVRGRDPYRHFESLPRPRRDMAPEDAARRDAVNAHWADFLYRGARERRAY